MQVREGRAMRFAFRFLVPLLLLLALIAWGASAVATRSARAWAERDLRSRARLVMSGSRETLARNIAASNRAGTRALLESLVRDERLIAATVCDRTRQTLAQAGILPTEARCEERKDREEDLADGADENRRVAGGDVHISIEPVIDANAVTGYLILVHDLSFVDRRTSTTRQALFLAFGLVGFAAAVATLLTARFSRRSWAQELRRILPGLLQGGRRAQEKAHQDFGPVLADVRELVASLATEEETYGGPWSAERLRRVLQRNLGGEGVVAVANREPYLHVRGKDGLVRVEFPASGLVTALEPVMRACSGTWIAHGSGSADREVVDRHDRVLVPPGEASYTLRRVWIDPEMERGYYYGFSNEGLWPLCHLADARPEFRAGDWHHYQEANRLFAQAVADEVQGKDPIVLVQDYHFALLPKMIHARLPRATVITFWHIPWPSAERFAICPWSTQLLEGLLGSSILGFHTQAHCNNFLESVDRTLEARIDRERQSVVVGGRETLVRAYPISVEWPSRWLEKVPPVAECRESVRAELGLPADARIGLGVDRLDYTKGIADRLLAVERLLERRPELVGKFWFVQVAAPSRTLIERYRLLGEEVERLTTRINERFGAGGRGPIVLLHTHHDPMKVFRLYRAADLCYVSSLHDGMNLVAKEFVSARDDLRGVLVLSRFTGAARELTEALLVNPYDLDAASSALSEALDMSEAEQEERMGSMRTLVSEFNVYRWAGRMLLDATKLRRRDRLTTRLAGEERAGVEHGP
jgi:trehalose 6-phosphate synthase